VPLGFNCSGWNCSQEGYVNLWLSHIPHAPATTTVHRKELYNNWWKYYAFYDQTVQPLITPTPGTFTSLSSTMPYGGNASFSFSYSSVTSSYVLEDSTLHDMSWDVYLSFAQGTTSPIVETNPRKWDKYSCGRSLYWRVPTSEGVKSPIQTQVVDCGATATTTLTPTSTVTPTPVSDLLGPSVN